MPTNRMNIFVHPVGVELHVGSTLNRSSAFCPSNGRNLQNNNYPININFCAI